MQNYVSLIFIEAISLINEHILFDVYVLAVIRVKKTILMGFLFFRSKEKMSLLLSNLCNNLSD